MLKEGQYFYMSHRLSPTPRLFQYTGRDNEWFDSFCNHVVVEVSTGEINHIEEKWFDLRTIKEVSGV